MADLGFRGLDNDDAQHLILDARSFQPVGELHYPGTTCLDPPALGDGTWLTIHGHTVRRRRTP
ncbi:hypothetical protein ACIREO_08270 [Streptomyces sp. NPDC102441]|uniref:hypothetical protein n=1 Tax=Streptomyces sp. NPDC102441 TaxID=3366176 RepID=UPI00380613A7